MKDIAIFGAGGFGREVLTLIQNINAVEEIWNVIGFFADGEPIGKHVHGFPILGGTKELNDWKTPLNIVFAIGTPKAVKAISSNITNPQIAFPQIIHPSVIFGDRSSVRLGKGCIICANTVLTCDIKIGDFVIMNLSCTVGHDAEIGNYSAFMPTCNISGYATVGECVYCGTGVNIIDRTSIGDDSIIGAGAVVTKPIPSDCTAVGVPARVI